MLVCLVEDDSEYAEIIAGTIRHDTHDVAVVARMEEARAFILRERPQLVVLDVILPDGSGLRLARELREARVRTPILMLTGLDRLDDVCAGLEAGADDYMTKPFHPRELLMRVRALLRRGVVELTSSAPADPVAMAAGWHGLEVDGAGRVTFRGRELGLTPIESQILGELMRVPDQVLSYTYLNSRIWQYSNLLDATLLKGHVSAIRRKLAAAGCDASAIRTISGVGYLFASQSLDEAQCA